MAQLIFYSSGLGRSITDFRGVAASGHPICLTLSDLSNSVAQAARRFNADGGLLLVDSGAYSVATGAAHTIDFGQVMAAYAGFVAEMPRPDCVTLIAPDVLGDMEASACLQWEHLPAMREIAEAGSHWVVPFQRGWSAMDDYAAHACLLRNVLGDFILGVPARRNVWPAEGLVGLVRAVAPARLHLLGLGVHQKRLAATLGVIWGAGPEIAVSHDATRLRAHVGKGRFLTEGVADELARFVAAHKDAWGAAGVRSFYLEQLEPGVVEGGDPEAMYEAFADQWDDTEYVHDLLHTPGALDPEQAQALAQSLGVTSCEDLARWAAWSQEAADEAFRLRWKDETGLAPDEEGESFGCCLGYLLAAVDFSGQFFMVRSPRHLVDMARVGRQNQRAEVARKNARVFRQQKVEELSRHDLRRQERLAVQTAFGF